LCPPAGLFQLGNWKIKDVRFTTEKEISALRVWLLGPKWATLLKKKRHLLTIDDEDETGIIQHPFFEGDDMDLALEEINEIRITRKKAEGSKDTEKQE
jgi:hypothetical protein